MISRGNSPVSIALAGAASCGSDRMLLFHNVTHVTATYLHAEAACFACVKVARVCDMARREVLLLMHPPESNILKTPFISGRLQLVEID